MSAEPGLTAPLLSMLALTGPLVAEAKARESARAAGLNCGPITGIPALDTLIGGNFEPGVHTLHGAPGSGKSALALGFALECLTPALYVSAELRPPVVARRLIARTQHVPIHEVKNMPSDRVYDRWCRVVNAYPMMGILDARKCAVPVSRMRECIDSLTESHGKKAKGIGSLVVVDSLNTWATRNLSDISDERERLDTAIEQFELLASTLEIPVLIVCERNRSGRNESGQTSMKGTGRLEYAGETVMGLDEVSEDELTPPQGFRAFSLHVSKNREGLVGKLPVYFNGAHQRHDPIIGMTEEQMGKF